MVLSSKFSNYILDLINTYYELNPSLIDEFFEDPSPLEFMRYVAQNRPFIIRGGADDWPAFRKWNVDYLRKAMSGQLVNVAITPCG
jgi:jumonji domain-containing protein 7